MRIIIDSEREEKILKAATRLGISPTRIINILVDRLEMIDMEEVVNFHFAPTVPEKPARESIVQSPAKKFTRKTKWWHDR